MIHRQRFGLLRPFDHRTRVELDMLVTEDFRDGKPVGGSPMTGITERYHLRIVINTSACKNAARLLLSSEPGAAFNEPAVVLKVACPLERASLQRSRVSSLAEKER